MEGNQPTTGKTGLMYGLLLGGASIIFGLMLYSADLHYTRGWEINLISILLMAAAIFIAISQFKKANGGFLSLAQAMKVGLATAVVAAIVGIIWQMLFMNLIEPDFMDKVFEISKAEMIEQNPKMTDEQIEGGEKMIKMFTSPSVIAVMGLVFSLFVGSIASLISGLIMKKQNDVI